MGKALKITGIIFLFFIAGGFIAVNFWKAGLSFLPAIRKALKPAALSNQNTLPAALMKFLRMKKMYCMFFQNIRFIILTNSNQRPKQQIKNIPS